MTEPDQGWAVRTEGLSKRYGGRLVVDGVDLAVPRGSVYGFLGPNGSGKTTTIRMLLGLVRPSAGRHTLLAAPMPESAAAVLPRVGALVEGPAFHPYLSGRNNLRRLLLADRTADPRGGSDQIATALRRVGLSAAGNQRYRTYSLGMRQRLALAATLLRPRELLILDEPTNGLDPQGTREVRALITSLAREGTTVLLSTHLLAEVEQICSHVGVMHRGRLVTQAPLPQLRTATARRALIQTDQPSEAGRTLRRLGLTGINLGEATAGGELGEVAPERIVAELVRDGVPVRGFTVASPGLEETFVALTGEGFDVSG
ncbi:ATP-binding cassette domain-containing protein [Natronosporangium hydrolyticum]|uniref:ATP-binding cassette domain-containing protein n=1 Tax=Natronosporangium hydrolyticum TaxID=2811111 RepID=A0A895YD71_9ACTN|nr:ATP-binding cassette domain-containing protein [Natronosporangium hydrolyticum]QSB15754.1 ATP-binding cassette domain-containing protein [Natronosporangium hydrolyticum]